VRSWWARESAASPSRSVCAAPVTRSCSSRFGDWHEPIRAVIEATPPESILRNDLYDREPLPRWSAGSVTLLGDAAHPATPGIGQGAGMAIEDAVVLVDCLAREADVGSALASYEAARRPRTELS
jgi:2-polyprenyl-6-methoxyphenol hydroxylase-like FAD-dependent oxidoreductase